MEARHKLNGLGRPRQWKVITSTLLLLFTFAIGNVWAAGTAIASLNFNEPRTLPSAYTYSSTNTPAIATFQSLSCINVSPRGGSAAPTFSGDNSAAPTGGKRWLAFQPAEDCSVTIKVGKANDSRTFYVLDKDHSTTSSSVSSYNPSAKNVWENSWVVNLKGGTWYAIIGSGSNCYIAAMSFVGAAKTDPTITFTDGAYTVGGSNLDLSSLFSSNSDGAVTYTVKTDGGTSASISGSSFSATAAGTAVVTASQAATSTYNAASKDANIVVSVPSTPTHEITYTNLKGSDVSAYPTEFYEGVGIASFDPLADVTDFHFNGWSPASIGTDIATDVEMTATWVAAYDVTFNINGGTGSAPDAFQKWEGATFELPGQGSMVAPSGRVFGGWKASGTKYAASAEYTMTNAAVEFVAQWDLLVEQVLYSWEGAEGGATEVGGTATHYNADAAVDGNPRVNYKTTANSVDYYTISLNGKADYSTDHIRIALTANAKAGDKVKMTAFYSKDSEKTVAPKIANSTNAELVTGSTPPNIYSSGVPALQTVILPVGADEAELRLTRSTTATNVFITKLQIVHEKAVPEEDIRTVTFNTNGGSAIAAVSVEKGTAVAQPADPTKAHCRFEGWQLSGSDYDFSSAVNSNITLDAVWTQLYTISFAAGDGSGDAPAAVADKAQGETFTVPANTFTAPTNKEFDKWNDGSVDYNPNDTYTVGTANVVLTAQWKALQDKYTVIFKDGDVTLGTKQFDVASNPSDADIDKTKPLFAFAAWQKDAADIALDDEFWATVVKDASVTLTARWTKVYAQDADLEGLVESEGTSADWQAYMSGKGYAYSTSGVSLDAKAGGKDYNNWPYQGLKAKEIGAYVEGRIAADKLVIIKLGHMAAAANVSLDGVAAGTATGLDADEPAGQLNYFYVENESVLRYETTNGGACVLKAITITDPFTVSFDANGGEDVASLNGTPSVTLPSATKGTESFLGWFDGETKVGEAGDKYTPTANITLKAHWEAISTDARLASITFSSDAGTLSPAFDPEVTSYTYTMPYGTAAVPTITAATSVSAKAQEPQIVSQASAWGETAVIRGVAESNDTKAYNITMLRAPKDGVCLVWGDITADNTITYNATNSKFYAESDVTLDTDVNGKDSGAPSGKKFQGGDHIQIGLNEGTFLAGDVVVLDVTYGTANKMYVFKAQAATAEDVIGELDGTTTPAGVNKVAITENAANLWLVRGGIADSWNPHVDYVAVYRAMNPILKAITINGEAGIINESAKTVAVELQPGYDLAALTINTTIISNTAEADVVKTVTSNSGNWVIGDNTYRLTDKDGDYTEYTVTLTAGELKHYVSFNTHGGSTIDPVQVVDGQKLAAAPAAPTKDDYIFQGWAETEDGSIVDVTSFTISADKEFHAIWASDGAIKLLDGATVNHTNFITGVTASTEEIESVEYNCVAFAGTVSGVNAVKDLTRVVAYNATTTQTKVQLKLYNSNDNSRTIEVKGVVEGSTDVVNLASITLTGNEQKTTEWIEFNNATNRTIYIYVSSNAGHIKILQTKVIESGTALKMAGEAGYSLNFNKGRFFGVKNLTAHFEGLDVEVASSDCAPLNTEVVKLASTSMSFTVASAMTLSVTTNNNKTYYVTKGSAGTDNETAKAGASDFDLTAGTWYITGGASNVEITNIAFSAPKCEQPMVVDMENIGLCEGDAFTALTVSANVTDGGTLHYQWYKHPAAGDDEAVGTDAASYTPEADGQYYVVVTNQLADHSDNSKASNMVTVEHFASAVITTAPLNQRATVGNNVTLSVAATGKNVAYKWYTCDEDGSNEAALDPEQTGTSIEVTITAGLLQWYKVKVTSDCGNAEAMAKVEEFVPATPANVTESIVWDWKSTTAGFPTENTSINFENTSVEELFADVDAAMPNNAEFRSDMLYGIGQRAWRKSDNDGECGFQGFQIRFYTEVAGRVRVYFRAPSSGQTSVVTINGRQAGSRGNSWGWSEYVDVEANTNVIIAMTNGETGMTRVQKIEFQTPNYVRTEMLGNGVYGTICVDHNVPEGGVRGVTVYEIAGREPQYGKIAFDEVTEMEAGVPYVFIAHGNEMALYYGETTVDDPVNGNGMYGTFEDQTLTELDGIYYFAQKALWSCVDLNSLSLPANRAYVKLSEIDYLGSSSPAPGRKRLLIGVNGAPAVATGFENVQGDNVQCTKVLINGQLFILRGEKMYDAKGQLVK